MGWGWVLIACRSVELAPCKHMPCPAGWQRGRDFKHHMPPTPWGCSLSHPSPTPRLPPCPSLPPPLQDFFAEQFSAESSGPLLATLRTLDAERVAAALAQVQVGADLYPAVFSWNDSQTLGAVPAIHTAFRTAVSCLGSQLLHLQVVYAVVHPPNLPLPPHRLPLQALGEGQELPPQLITALFEALSYDVLLEGKSMPCWGIARVPCNYCKRGCTRPLAFSSLAADASVLVGFVCATSASPMRARAHTQTDAEVADGLAAALCTLSARYDLALAEPGGARYPGAYRVLAHPSADARRLVSRLADWGGGVCMSPGWTAVWLAGRRPG